MRLTFQLIKRTIYEDKCDYYFWDVYDANGSHITGGVTANCGKALAQMEDAMEDIVRGSVTFSSCFS